eukprot:363781-Chlamydomonas_euryale.AAC.1
MRTLPAHTCANATARPFHPSLPTPTATPVSPPRTQLPASQLVCRAKQPPPLPSRAGARLLQQPRHAHALQAVRDTAVPAARPNGRGECVSGGPGGVGAGQAARAGGRAVCIHRPPVSPRRPRRQGRADVRGVPAAAGEPHSCESTAALAPAHCCRVRTRTAGAARNKRAEAQATWPGLARL